MPSACATSTNCPKKIEELERDEPFRRPIFLEPRIVVWLAGAVAVLLGIMLLVMARFMGRLRNR